MSTKVILKYGAMNSGKSLDLIKIAYNYQTKGYKVSLLKPEIDTRVKGKIFSRTGLEMNAHEIDNNVENVKAYLNNEAKDSYAIFIDECNFLSPEIVDALIDFTYDNDISSIIFYGLKVNFRGEMFPATRRIIERADKIEESTSLCFCGKKARQNGRIINGELVKSGPEILVENDENDVEYVTLCNYHFYEGRFE